MPNSVLGGLLGEALAANHAGRLSHFIENEQSEAIALFDRERARDNHEGDWYGEHAGKWLYAAARAAKRTNDAKLEANVRRVADYLVSMQEPDGYLGTYAPERRFMRKQPPGKRTWDGAPSQRTWDVWVHAYLVLGLLEVNRLFPAPSYLAAASSIGDLCARTLESGIDITHLGNHFGMSATVFLDPAVELFTATGNAKYLDLAERILAQAEGRTELQLLSQASGGADASEIGTGKAYQLLWNVVGFAKLHRATGEARYLVAARRVWDNVRRHHITLGGGPWGGVAHRSREVFNPASVFSPHGYVETCSTLAWIQLNRELSHITGDPAFAEEIERSAYNDLLGAFAPNGEDWCYYCFPNGKRVNTTHWRCCKSSGAIALEELPPLAYSLVDERTIAVQLYGPSRTTLGGMTLEQVTDYPFDGAIQLKVDYEGPFTVRVRIPSWAEGARVDGEPARPGTYVAIERVWKKGDTIALDFPMPPVKHERASRNVQESRAPDGSPVAQEVMRFDYVAITRGPLVYATTRIDGFKTEETLRLDGSTLEVVSPTTVRLNLAYREPLLFQPYFEAGGRNDGAWRLTWMHVEHA